MVRGGGRGSFRSRREGGGGGGFRRNNNRGFRDFERGDKFRDRDGDGGFRGRRTGGVQI